jgi:nitrogen fixation protein FixH
MRWFHWGTGVALVYVLFAGSTLGFVTFALNNPVELVSADYYERSLEHDQRVEAEGHARALGARLQVTIRPGAAALDVAIPPEAAPAASGRIILYRPSDAQADRTIPLSLDADGRQSVAIASLSRGRWLVRIEWESDGRAYAHEQALVLP